MPNSHALAITDQINDRELSAIRSLVEEYAAHHNVQGAALTGSVMAGLANALSDIDFVLVVDNKPSFETSQHLIDGRRYGVEILSREELIEMTDWLSSYSVTTTNRMKIEISESDLRRRIRLFISQDVVPSQLLDEARRQFDGNSVRKTLMTLYGWRVSNRIQDTYGALESGDLTTAIVCSSEVVQLACEVLLANWQDYYVESKFLLRRLERHSQDPDVVETVWRLLRLPARDRLDQVTHEVVARRLLFATWIVASCLLDGWEDPLMVLPKVKRGSGGPMRDCYYSVVRYSDAVGLVAPESGLHVGPQAAKLWSLSNGIGIRELENLMADWLSLEQDAVRPHVRETLHALAGAAAVRL